MHRQALRRSSVVFALVAILFALFGLSSSAQAALVVALIGAMVCALALTASVAATQRVAVPIRVRRY